MTGSKIHSLAAPGFLCSACGHHHEVGESEYTCLKCGPTGILEPLPHSSSTVGSDRALFGTSPGIWRYERLLAISPEAPRPPLVVGGTQLVEGGLLSKKLGLKHLYIKNDTVNPSGSLKDRASAVAVARAGELGARRIAVASTGNAGSSVACLAASVGMAAAVFVPRAAPRAKLVQALAYGADVFAVDGSYDDAFELCLEACEAFGWYNRNTAFNPYTIEGKKTVSYEVYEQLGGRAPDYVFVPTGDGCILSGVARGFRDLRDLGLLDTVPRLIAVQAEGSNAIAQACMADGPINRVKAASVADSITVDLPRNGAMAVRDIRATAGTAVTVTDGAILAAVGELARTTGIFAEPAGAASLAGLHAYQESGVPLGDASVVLLVTGSGLKDIDSASRAGPRPHHVRPMLRDIETIVAGGG